MIFIILGKLGGRVWTGFIGLRMGAVVKAVMNLRVSKKGQEFLTS